MEFLSLQIELYILDYFELFPIFLLGEELN